MAYTVKINETKNDTSLIIDFVADYGAKAVRVVSHEKTVRESSVVIPFASGRKNTSDGEVDTGTVTVRGILTGSEATIEGYIAAIEATLLAQADGYYVWMDYGGTDKHHDVTRMQSIGASYVDGWGGRQQEFVITFISLDPDFS